MTSLHSYPKRSIPKTLFGTLTNLLLAAQKQLSVRTLIIQKPVKWFEMQNGWLVSKRSTFLVKGISKQTWTHFQSIFHLWTNQVVGWKSYILTKDASDWPASLFKKFSMGIFLCIYHLTRFQVPRYKQMLLKIIFFSYIAGKTLIVVPLFSHWNSYLTRWNLPHSGLMNFDLSSSSFAQEEWQGQPDESKFPWILLLTISVWWKVLVLLRGLEWFE